LTHRRQVRATKSWQLSAPFFRVGLRKKRCAMAPHALDDELPGCRGAHAGARTGAGPALDSLGSQFFLRSKKLRRPGRARSAVWRSAWPGWCRFANHRNARDWTSVARIVEPNRWDGRCPQAIGNFIAHANRPTALRNGHRQRYGPSLAVKPDGQFQPPSSTVKRHTEAQRSASATQIHRSLRVLVKAAGAHLTRVSHGCSGRASAHTVRRAAAGFSRGV
jgi:hypothetical protein